MLAVKPSAHEVPDRVLARIFDRVDVRGAHECWPWLLSIGNHGYGQVGWSAPDGRKPNTVAHMVAWMAVHGPIPPGMTVDHIKATGCKGGRCCNPGHLRLLSNVDNARDNGAAEREARRREARRHG